jgi:hypothetical protein
MRIFTKTELHWDEAGKRYFAVPIESYEYDGPLDLACGGASQQQKDIGASQSHYYDVLTKQAQEEFGLASGIFNQLKGVFSPILEAGINQQGFSKEELDTLNAQVINQTGSNYKNAELAAQGGGNVRIGNGANDLVRERVAESSAQVASNEELQVQENNYATGRQNFLNAASILSGAPGVFSGATAAAGAANNAGADASQTANEITQANNSWMGLVGGVLGAGLSGWATGGFKTPGSSSSGCWIAEKIWGVDDCRTHLVRAYLNRVWAKRSVIGKTVMWAYRTFGRQVAEIPAAVRALTPLFNIALRKVEAEVA